ncbi:VanZ family protein [Paenarthrobacter nitroguajacolicus]|uniref:VanZ family protein n=1 Tax=Paenarthrobacter nitroguajacolicus TaxID=211146 RepID=UPI000B2F9186|nr:VanZ family protein [Paenarthrobacter nitroguajacolicus]
MACRVSWYQNKASTLARRFSEIFFASATGRGSHKRLCVGAHQNYLKTPLKNLLPWRIALVTYVIGLAMVAYWPTPVDEPIQGTLAKVLNYLHAQGVPEWFDYQFIEASANVAMFVPLGIFAALAMPSRACWQLVGMGLLASICMELGQLLFITARIYSAVDLVTNTLGCVIGIFVIWWVAPPGHHNPRGSKTKVQSRFR